MKLEINPYDEQVCRAIVEEKFLPAIRRKFGTSAILVYDRVFPDKVSGVGLQGAYKEYGCVPTPRCLASVSLYSCAIFYYLNFLNLESTVTDIGCGENLLKDILPTVHGIDPDGTLRDEEGSFDNDGTFAANHSQQFESAIAINSIHYISLVDFSKQVNRFASMIKSGGRGLVVMNTIRMLEKTKPEELISLFNTTEPSPLQIEEYIDQELKALNLNLLVAENVISSCIDEWMDGNIRLVFEV